MVQLKGHHHHTTPASNGFQYLMVQLKAKERITCSSPPPLFQYLMVQLKAINKELPVLNCEYFNTSWYN